VDIAEAAWEPVFASFRELLGDNLFEAGFTRALPAITYHLDLRDTSLYAGPLCPAPRSTERAQLAIAATQGVP